MANVNFAGVSRFRQRIQKLGRVTMADVEPLLTEWERILVEDNRRGVLMGLDKNGLPAPPLKYRKGGSKGFVARRAAKSSLPTAEARASDRNIFGGRNRRFKGKTRYRGKARQLRASGILPNNNLATWLYRTLSGPRLAPRGDASRAISNLKTHHASLGRNHWIASAGWLKVVSAKGRPFLDAHFGGLGRLPRYDLRGVRL